MEPDNSCIIPGFAVSAFSLFIGSNLPYIIPYSSPKTSPFPAQSVMPAAVLRENEA
jgi:hypothetical protein